MTLKTTAFNRIFLLSIMTFALISCGGGSDLIFDDSDTTEVTDLSADDNSLNVGGATIVSAKFSFSEDDVFNDNDIVALVIQVPSELRFRLGTAEIQANVGDDDKVGAQVFNCPTGEQYLLFELDDNDLIDADDPSGDADAELTLTLDAIAAIPSGTVIQAFASRESANFGCGQIFNSEESDVITINP